MTRTKRQVRPASAPAPFKMSRLARACVLASGALVAGGAAAQASNYSGIYGGGAYTPPTWTVSGFAFWITTDVGEQFNSGINNASVLTPGVGHWQAGGSVAATISSNSIPATARGNTSTNSIDMALLVNNGAGDDGLGIATSQTNATNGVAGAGAQISSVTGMPLTGTIFINLSNTDAALAQNLTSNTVRASSILNVMDNAITGIAPVGYTSAQTGNATLTSDAGGTLLSGDSAGGLSLHSVQVAENTGASAGSGATLTDTTVRLDIHHPGVAAVPQTANLTVSNNTLAAEYGANAGANIIQANAGSGAITGAASLASMQVNLDAGSNTTTATVTGAGVHADIRSTTAGDPNTLTATLDLTSNSVSATSRGNDVTNQIRFLSGAAVTGTGTAAANTGSADNGASTVATATADVGLANLQVNKTTDGAPVAIASSITTSGITAATDSLAPGGVVNVTSNAVQAVASGSSAVNAIGATATTYAATTAVSSSQSNDGIAISATNVGTAISATTGMDTVTTLGTVNASSNTISAAATGNANNSSVTLSPTNSITVAAPASSGSTLTATAGGATASGFTNGGISIGTVQSNTSIDAATTITATLTNATVSNTSADTVQVTNPDVLQSTFTATGNSLSAAAVGNTNTNTGTLSGASITTTAAVSSTQFNGADVTGTVNSTPGSGTGVTVLVGNADTSTLAVSSNTIAASGTGSSTNNTLSVAANTLTAGPAAYAGSVTGDADATTGVVNSNAAFSVSAVQLNEGMVSSSNRTRTDFATVTAGVEGSGSGIFQSTLTVTGNAATSTTTANASTNSLSIAPGLLATSDGVAAQLGAVSNLQVNNNAVGVESSRVGGQAAGQLMGITYLEAVDAASTLTVTGNSMRATSRGNDTANTLSANIGGYTASASVTPNGNINSADNVNLAGPVSVTSDFALVNNQQDTAPGRTATADNAVISIDDAAGTLIQSMNGQLTLTGNTVAAEGRNNNAINTLTLTGATGNVNTTAGLINQQVSATPLTATTESTFRVRATGTVNPIGGDAATATAITMTGNQSSAMAVGNSAANAVVASGVLINGNAAIAAGGVSFDATTLVTNADADFGAVNVQTQTGTVSAVSTSSVQLNLDASQVVSVAGPTQLTVTGNGVQSLAQANSARTTLDLAGTGITAAAAVGNVQEAGADVTATHTSPTTGGGDTPAFLIRAGDPLGVTGAAMTVTGNSISVSAGQNAADNWLQTNTTTLTGRALGTNTLAYDNTTGSGSVTTDLAVMNIQRATGGAVSATTAQPGDIGASLELMDGGSLAVTGNTVNASGSINNASNLLAMDRAGAPTTVSVSTTGGIVNGQGNTAGQSVTAAVGDAALATHIGVRAEPGGPSLTISNIDSAPVLNVTGNSVGSNASGNVASSALTASATASITLATAGQSLAILSDQVNNATMSATTRNLAFGVNAAASGGGETSVTGATVNVTGNNATATGGGNTATNTVSAAADMIAGGDASVPAIAITNNQLSDVGATVTSLVDTVTAGIDASGAVTPGVIDGSTVNVLSNRMQAIGYGNNATSTLTVNAATGLSSDASAAIANTQNSNDAVSATANAIRAGVFAGNNAITDTAGPTVVTVSGNQVSAIGGGSTAVNVLNGSAGAILSPSNVTPTFSLNSTQGNLGNNQANATNVSIGAVSGSLVADSTLSVLSNRVQSSVYGNDDANTMNLSATAGSASMFSGVLSGTQTNSGTMDALTNAVDVGYVNNAVGGTVSTTTTLQVSGNVISGTAGANTTSNVLNMTAGMASGTPLAPNFSLTHTQTNDALGAPTANVTNVRVGMFVTDVGSTVQAQGLNTLSNTIQSSAYANSSNNALNLTATAGSTTGFTGALNGTQSNAAAVTSGVSAITVGPSIAGTSTDTPMLVSGNQVNAIGGGNTAVNALNAISGAAFGTPSPAPMYSLANGQTNTGTVDVTALNVNIGAMPATVTSTGNVNIGVLGNSILASGYGNAATNTVGVTTPLWGGAPVASASLQNSQFNSGNVTVSVSTSTIGAGLTTGGMTATGGFTSIVTGNSIGAQAIGNTAVNRITSR